MQRHPSISYDPKNPGGTRRGTGPDGGLGIAVKFYDADGIMIGDGRKTVRDLGPGETARLTIPYRGFADRVEVDEIRVIV